MEVKFSVKISFEKWSSDNKTFGQTMIYYRALALDKESIVSEQNVNFPVHETLWKQPETKAQISCLPVSLFWAVWPNMMKSSPKQPGGELDIDAQIKRWCTALRSEQADIQCTRQTLTTGSWCHFVWYCKESTRHTRDLSHMFTH